MAHIHELDQMKSVDIFDSQESFRKLLGEFEASMKRAFHGENDINMFCSTRGIPGAVLIELMSENPLSLCIPKEFGGFGGK